MPPLSYFRTGDALTAGTLPVLLFVPHSQAEWVYLALTGALVDLSTTTPWITGGESTPDDAAAIFKTILETMEIAMIDVGDIKWSAAPAGPSGPSWLLCDGSLYLRSAWPALFTAIGTTYNQVGDPGDSFRVPDLRGRVLAGMDSGANRLTDPAADSLGGTLGTEAVTLTTAEMPSHDHSIHGHLTLLAVVPGEGLVNTPSISSATGATGGDGAHDNVQPVMVMRAYILAEI